MRISSCLCWCFYSPSLKNQVGKNSQINKELEQKPYPTVEVDEVKLEVEEEEVIIGPLKSNLSFFDNKVVPINYNDEGSDEEVAGILKEKLADANGEKGFNRSGF